MSTEPALATLPQPQATLTAIEAAVHEWETLPRWAMLELMRTVKIEFVRQRVPWVTAEFIGGCVTHGSGHWVREPGCKRDWCDRSRGSK